MVCIFVCGIWVAKGKEITHIRSYAMLYFFSHHCADSCKTIIHLLLYKSEDSWDCFNLQCLLKKLKGKYGCKEMRICWMYYVNMALCKHSTSAFISCVLTLNSMGANYFPCFWGYLFYIHLVMMNGHTSMWIWLIEQNFGSSLW